MSSPHRFAPAASRPDSAALSTGAALPRVLLASLRWVARHGMQLLSSLDRRPVRVRLLGEADIARIEGVLPCRIGRSFFDELLDQRRDIQSVLIVWKGRQPLALGHVNWSGPRHPDVRAAFPGCPEIYELSVRPMYRSAGLGTRMIRAFETMARERGHGTIGLGVTYDNARAAELYFRLGYGQPAPSDFIDEFDAIDRTGRLRHQAAQARFLVKPL